MNDFEPSEIDALKQVARERMAFDTIRNKVKSTWIWVVATGALTCWALWDKIFEVK